MQKSVREPHEEADVPLVDQDDRVVRRPDADDTFGWLVADIDADVVMTRAGLPGDEAVWVTPEVLETFGSSHVNGVPVLISLAEAHALDPVEDIRRQAQADYDRVYSHSFQVEGMQMSFGPPDGALLAPFLFRLAYMPSQAFNPRDADRLALDEAVTAVTSNAYNWLLELWRWAGVVGARRTPPKQQQRYRYLADLVRPTGEVYQVMPYPHRTTISESQILLPRRATPLTPDTFSEIVDLVTAGTPAPAAPLLVMNAVDTADGGDLRSAMVLAGTALDLVLDEMWTAARLADPTLPDLSGTLGQKAAAFQSKSIDLPLGLARSALQDNVIKIRNSAAHGDEMAPDEVWGALSVMIDIASERWPEGQPSQWLSTSAT